MQEQTSIKQYVGVAAIIALVAFSFAVVRYVFTYDRVSEPGSFRSFSASGDGKAVVIPDVAEFTFEVITEGGTDLGNLQQANTQKVNGAVAFVKSKGVGAKDVKTQGYSVEPRYQYSTCIPNASYGDKICPPPKIVGYTVRSVVSIKVRNFDEIGNILSGVVTNGANSVSGLAFTVDDPTEVENEARAQAIAKAKSKAEALARAGGFKLGRLLSVSEGGNYPIYGKFEAFGRGGDAAPVAMPAPTIEPGSQEFHVTMTLVYEIR